MIGARFSAERAGWTISEPPCSSTQNRKLVARLFKNDLSRLALPAYAVPMPETQNAPASTASSFAGLLSSLTSPPLNAHESWDDSALDDDLATISYERALRAHARTKHSSVDASRLTRASRAKDSAPRAAIVTLRLSHAESAQLHERANEAGLTVSAYLRSCVFEVEALRAQVREALSQFRSAASNDPHVARKPAQSALPTWRSRFFPRWSRGQGSIDA
jgi:hypothetical protein